MNVTMKAVLLAGACAMPLWGASAATANFDIQSLYNNPSTTAVYGGTGFVGVYGGSYTSQYGALLGLEYDFSSTLLQVDISSLAGATINSAQLSFDLVNGTTGSFTTEVTRFTADGTIEYSSGSPDDLGSASFAPSGLASNAFDVTSLLAHQPVPTGRRVAVLWDGPAAGVLDLAVDGAALPAGAYFVRVVGDAFAETRSLVVAR